MLGVNYGKVKVVPYRSEWTVLYQQECEKISSALGDDIIAVEHIGSTSIPGIPSKAFLDIMAVVRKGITIGDLVTKLHRIDCQYEADFFNVVVCEDVLEHVSDLGKTIAEVKRVLKNIGAFLFDTVNKTDESKMTMITIMEDVLKVIPN